MSKREQFKQSREERQRRIFSEEFKRRKLREIGQQLTTIAAVSRQYEVRANSVSKWRATYGQPYTKGVRTIVESQSGTAKLDALTHHHGEKQGCVEFAYENGKEERLNGITKNTYLNYYETNTLGQLHK